MTTTWEDKIRNDDRFRSMAQWSGIPIQTYSTHRLYNFVAVNGIEEAQKAALAFVSGKAQHHFITFIGETGRGKTHLALGIGWHWLENDLSLVKYWQVESLLDDLRHGFKADTEEKLYQFDEVMKQIKMVPLLILDDLGVEQSTPWARAKLDEIIDHRYINEARTVITTNLDPGNLEPRVASRLREGIVALLKCGDYREIKAQMRAKMRAKMRR